MTIGYLHTNGFVLNWYYVYFWIFVTNLKLVHNDRFLQQFEVRVVSLTMKRKRNLCLIGFVLALKIVDIQYFSLILFIFSSLFETYYLR